MIYSFFFHKLFIVCILFSLFDLLYSARTPRKSTPQNQEIDLNQPAPEWDAEEKKEAQQKPAPYNKNAASRTPEMQRIYKQRWRAKIQKDPGRLKRMKEKHSISFKQWRENLPEEKKAERRARARVIALKSRLKNKNTRYGGFSSLREFQRNEIIERQQAGKVNIADLSKLEQIRSVDRRKRKTYYHKQQGIKKTFSIADANKENQSSGH